MKEVLASPKTVAASLLSGATLAMGLAPTAQAEKPAAVAAKETKGAKQARLVTAQLGGRILKLADSPKLLKEGNCKAKHVYTSRALAGKPTDPEVKVTCRSGQSLVPNGSGAYRFKASLPGGLHRKPRGSDVSEVSMEVGGRKPSRPFAKAALSRIDRNDWEFSGEYVSKGDTINYLDVATDERRDIFKLTASRAKAIGSHVNQAIDSALDRQPTGLLEPPFQTVSIEGVTIEGLEAIPPTRP